MLTTVPKIRVKKTSDIRNPHYYIKALMGEFADWAFTEVQAPTFRGDWRKEVFKKKESDPMDLEIGTGNGLFFAEFCQRHPDRSLVGLELKFKPLIQTIRRARRFGCENGRVARFHASDLDIIFAPKELDNVFVYFPDPWTKKRQNKNRLIQHSFLDKIYELQKPNRQIEVKTDNRDYFDWIVAEFKKSRYQIDAISYDLHNSAYDQDNFRTFFEKLLSSQGFPIHLLRATRI